MFIVVFNEEDKEMLLSKGYKLIQEDFVDKTKRYTFANKTSGERLDFAKENIHAFTTNKLYF